MTATLTTTEHALNEAPLYDQHGPYWFRERPLMISRGHPVPLGARRAHDGINFVTISRHGTAVWLVLSEPCGSKVLA